MPPLPPLAPLALNHLNLPARDPAALRRWVARVLGFRAHNEIELFTDPIAVKESE